MCTFVSLYRGIAWSKAVIARCVQFITRCNSVIARCDCSYPAVLRMKEYSYRAMCVIHARFNTSIARWECCYPALLRVKEYSYRAMYRIYHAMYHSYRAMYHSYRGMCHSNRVMGVIYRAIWRIACTMWSSPILKYTAYHKNHVLFGTIGSWSALVGTRAWSRMQYNASQCNASQNHIILSWH